MKRETPTVDTSDSPILLGTLTYRHGFTRRSLSTGSGNLVLNMVMREIPGSNGTRWAGDDGYIYKKSVDGVLEPIEPCFSGGHEESGRYLSVHFIGNAVNVHVLVAAAWIGPRPVGMHVNHKDGRKTNCRPSNLEYVTPSENQLHARQFVRKPGSKKFAGKDFEVFIDEDYVDSGGGPTPNEIREYQRNLEVRRILGLDEKQA